MIKVKDSAFCHDNHSLLSKLVAISIALLMIAGTLPPTYAASPRVSAYKPTSITMSSASLSGYIDANNGINIRQAGLQYKLASSSTWITCYTKDPRQR